MAPMADEKPTVASEGDGVNDGFGKAVRGGSGADVGRPFAGTVDDRAGGELAIGTGLVEDEDDTARRARKAADGEGDAGRAGRAGGGGADSAFIRWFRADVGRQDVVAHLWSPGALGAPTGRRVWQGAKLMRWGGAKLSAKRAASEVPTVVMSVQR